MAVYARETHDVLAGDPAAVRAVTNVQAAGCRASSAPCEPGERETRGMVIGMVISRLGLVIATSSWWASSKRRRRQIA